MSHGDFEQGADSWLPSSMEQEALRQIREIHATQGRQLDRDEAKSFLEMFVDLGAPVAKNGTRGPKAMHPKTQYERAAERRKNLYRRLFKAPKVRKGKGHLAKHVRPIETVLIRLSRDRVPVRKLVSKTMEYFELSGQVCFSRRSIQRIMANLIAEKKLSS